MKINENYDELREYARKKINFQSRTVPNYDIFVQKYLTYARGFNPTFSEQALEMIEQYYVELQQSSSSQSKRKLETIMRLCKAISKLKLKNVIDGEDAHDAMSYYNSVLKLYDGIIAPIPQDPQKVIYEKCLRYLEECNGNGVLFSELIKGICIENENLRSYLLGTAKIMDEKKLTMEGNKKVRKICEKLRSHKNVELINKNPIKLRYIEKRESSVNWSEGSEGSGDDI
jgi:DNA replicative helicase MCM subunit Mcm2 (Cdc46/Mcm family)